jgi:DNA polymerase (family 10)
MKLEEAMAIAERLEGMLSPYCDKIGIAGSIRRQRPVVKDIDLVAVVKPGQELLFDSLLYGLGKTELSGPKIWRIRLPEGISADFYLATEGTWATLLLIRTGSAESNIRLSSLARSKGWHLKASGEGLFDENGNRVAGDSERSVFEALGIPYQEPNERG